MALSGRSFDPTKSPPPPSGPVVDYRLARRSLLASLRRGSLDVADVCDAHPELLRAGKNIGSPLSARCPVCSHETLRTVSYVYGEGLKRDNGRVVYPEGWLEQLAKDHDQFTCYEVEVCIDCSWNHLLKAFQAGRRWGSAGGGRNGSRTRA